METANQLYFDPFAEGGEAMFDATESFQQLFKRYENKEVEHDYTADKFVADTETLMLDAQFVGQFEAAQTIAQRMHALCGDDHMLQTSMSTSELFNHQQSSHDGHVHEYRDHEDSTKKREAKKNKKKKTSSGWLQMVWNGRKSNQAKNNSIKLRSK